MKKTKAKLHVVRRTDILGRTIALCGASLNMERQPLTIPKLKCHICSTREKNKNAINKINS